MCLVKLHRNQRRKIKGIIRDFLRSLQERRKKKEVYPNNKGAEEKHNTKNKIESWILKEKIESWNKHLGKTMVSLPIQPLRNKRIATVCLRQRKVGDYSSAALHHFFFWKNRPRSVNLPSKNISLFLLSTEASQYYSWGLINIESWRIFTPFLSSHV